MPRLALFFEEDFKDKSWADRTHFLEAPHQDSGLARLGEWLIGRHPAADLTINCRDISRRHAAISYSYAANRWAITDLGSKYGTFLGGQKLTVGDPTPIDVGDRFWLGSNKVSVVVDEGDTLGGADPGEQTIADTQPLDHRPQGAVMAAPAPPPVAPAPPPPPAPAPTKTTADAIYLAAQWCITPTTKTGAAVRLLLLAVGAVVVVLIHG